MPGKVTRRSFVLASAAGGLAAASGLALPALGRAQSRPISMHGVQSGDVDTSSGMIWARADRPAQALLEIDRSERFADPRRFPPLDALPETDCATKWLVEGLPADQDMFYRIRFVDFYDIKAVSEPLIGRFRTAPAAARSIRFVWSADTAGQGWGIDESRGGMKTYRTMLGHAPDFFLHSGDSIYADGPIAAEQALPGGGVWRNLVAEGVEKVAETLEEFRGRWKYNLRDRNLREFNAAVPTFFQWDDHEVVDNWSPSKNLLADDRYAVKSVPLLAARARRAFHEMTPVRYTPAEPGRVYRKISYGPLLDVFFIDLRSYRQGNSENLQAELTPEARIIGETQLGWLKRALAASEARWKVVASDMPIGLIVWDDWKERKGSEAVANGDHGTAKGRELELADLLSFIKHADIRNVVWLTADVHYTAAHHYSPDRASFQDFEPFWEFVSGPLHAGTFGPNELDGTFGPEVRFVKAPGKGKGQNLPPSDGLQFFGIVEIDGSTETMTVRLMDREDRELHRQVIDPVGPGRRRAG